MMSDDRTLVTTATVVATLVCLGLVASVVAQAVGHSDPPRPSPTVAAPRAVDRCDAEWEATRLRWGAEGDCLELLLSERQEPHGGIHCYRRRDRYECPVRLYAGPTRWAACRPRRADERHDDGSRCTWIVGDGGL